MQVETKQMARFVRRVERMSGSCQNEKCWLFLAASLVKVSKANKDVWNICHMEIHQAMPVSIKLVLFGYFSSFQAIFLGVYLTILELGVENNLSQVLHASHAAKNHYVWCSVNPQSTDLFDSSVSGRFVFSKKAKKKPFRSACLGPCVNIIYLRGIIWLNCISPKDSPSCIVEKYLFLVAL